MGDHGISGRSDSAPLLLANNLKLALKRTISCLAPSIHPGPVLLNATSRVQACSFGKTSLYRSLQEYSRKGAPFL